MKEKIYKQGFKYCIICTLLLMPIIISQPLKAQKDHHSVSINNEQTLKDSNDNNFYFEYEVIILDEVIEKKNKNGNPIEGVQIVLTNKNLNSVEKKMTDAEGKASLILHPNTTYEIKITKENYIPKKLYISVSNLDKLEFNTITFTLKKFKKSLFFGGAIIAF